MCRSCRLMNSSRQKFGTHERSHISRPTQPTQSCCHSSFQRFNFHEVKNALFKCLRLIYLTNLNSKASLSFLHSWSFLVYILPNMLSLGIIIGRNLEEDSVLFLRSPPWTESLFLFKNTLLFLRFHIYVLLYGICLSLFDLFHSV